MSNIVKTESSELEEAPSKNMDIRILICQRGWVYIGRFERYGVHITLTDGACIRVWGTKGDHMGLGYLAERGPTKETHLEPFTRPFETLELTVIGKHTCNPEIWSDVLDNLVMPK